MPDSVSSLLSVQDACRVLQISPATIYRFVASHRLTAYKVGGPLRFSADQLDEFLRSSLTASGPGRGAALRPCAPFKEGENA